MNTLLKAEAEAMKEQARKENPELYKLFCLIDEMTPLELEMLLCRLRKLLEGTA